MNNPIRLLFVFASALLAFACTPDSEPAVASTTPDDVIDLIIDGDHIVTMDTDRTVIAKGAIAVDDGVIIAIQPSRRSPAANVSLCQVSLMATVTQQ